MPRSYETRLLDGVVDADDLPSASQINKRMRRDLVMSKKKLSVIPSESNTPEQIARQDECLNVISTFKPHQIHFFDEASVIKTTGNCSYGNATVGEKSNRVSTIRFERKFYCQLAPLTFRRKTATTFWTAHPMDLSCFTFLKMLLKFNGLTEMSFLSAATVS